MATYIKTLKEDNGDITYPQTKGSAVLLDGGSDLETVLAAKADASTVNQKITVGDVQSTDIVANAVTTAKIADSNVTAAKLASNSVLTAKIADGAVTAAKIDWTTLGYHHTASSAQLAVNTSNTTLLSFQLTAGTWLLIGTSDFNHANTTTGDAYIGFWNLTANTSIGNVFYFNELNNGTYWSVETAHEVVTLTSAANIGFVAKKGQGTLYSTRKSFTAIRIG